MHRIHRAEIHLDVHAPDVAGELIDRCSELHARAIAPLIDRVCSELGDPDRIDRIDRLELDLGVLALEDFEGELLRKLEAALRTSLKGALARHEAVDRRRSAIELLETFATLGNLPWWASTTGDPVAAAISTLSEHDPPALLELVHLLAGDRPGLTRLARHADERACTTLATRRGPVAAAALLVAVRALERALPREVPVLRSALLAAIAGPDREAPRVLQEMLLELAAAHDWRLPELHTHLAAVARIADMPGLLRETLVALGFPTQPAAVAPIPGRPEPGRTAIDDHGVPPAKVEVSPADTPATIAGAAAAAATITAAPTPIDLASPAPASATTTTHSSTASTTGDRSTTPSRPAASVTAARTTDPRTARPPPRTTRPAPMRRPDPAQQAARARALARIDGLHVDDGGLVLLWPFLDRLCHRCGLVDDQRRFVDEPAQHRAVALFEMIVTGELAPPEFRLPLAKLLAGLTPDTSLMLAAPLDPAWREECERLLVAVLGHVPALGELDPAELRAGFLRRAAVLDVHNGAWTLRVERAAHDAVLDRLPWSWAWVKSPWMPDTLRVEW